MFTSPFLFFFASCPLSFPVLCNTIWLCEIGLVKWIPRTLLCGTLLWNYFSEWGGGGRYWIPLKASSIISLEMKILRKSQRKEDWRGYESFISLNVQQVSPPLPFVTTIRTAPSDVDTVSVAQKRSDAYISDLWHFSHICNTCPVFVMCSIHYFKM